jgi:SAM-dependent methyltransferase
MAERVPAEAGNVYGRVLAYHVAPTLAAWSRVSGLWLHLSRWYARVLGFPELAAHRRFPVVRDMLHRHAGERVLDLGAGNGLYSIADAVLRPASSHILADLSVRHMHRATATGRALGLPLWGIACSAQALPFASASFDTILLIEVLQFVDDDQAAVKEVGRVLRRGGYWLCEQDRPPEGTPLTRVTEARLQKRRIGYTEKSLCHLAAAAGLVLEDSQPVSGRIGRWWESFDGRLFRKSRAIHFLLFPILRLLAGLFTNAALQRQPGTVLYLFRKPSADEGRS